MKYLRFNHSGKIIGWGNCQDQLFHAQFHDGEYGLQVSKDFDYSTELINLKKVQFDGFDDEEQPINPQIVDKTPEEIKTDEDNLPKPPPYEKQQANITNEQLQSILDRLKKLE